MPIPWGPLIGAVGSIFGGALAGRGGGSTSQRPRPPVSFPPLQQYNKEYDPGTGHLAPGTIASDPNLSASGAYLPGLPGGYNWQDVKGPSGSPTNMQGFNPNNEFLGPDISYFKNIIGRGLQGTPWGNTTSKIQGTLTDKYEQEAGRGWGKYASSKLTGPGSSRLQEEALSQGASSYVQPELDYLKKSRDFALGDADKSAQKGLRTRLDALAWGSSGLGAGARERAGRSSARDLTATRSGINRDYQTGVSKALAGDAQGKRGFLRDLLGTELNQASREDTAKRTGAETGRRMLELTTSLGQTDARNNLSTLNTLLNNVGAGQRQWADLGSKAILAGQGMDFDKRKYLDDYMRGIGSEQAKYDYLNQQQRSGLHGQQFQNQMQLAEMINRIIGGRGQAHDQASMVGYR